jgi:transposase InsO family protein
MIPFVLDTGADVTVLTEKTFAKLACPGSSPSKVLKGADGNVLKVKCETCVEMTSKHGMSTVANAFVVRGATNNLLGKREINDLEIISVVCNVQRDSITDRFQDLFEGLGTLPEVFKINLTPGGRAYNLNVPRRVPIGLRERVKEELDRMQAMKVISPIEKDTEWCAGIVVAPKKNGKVRLCIDLSQLNKHVRRELFPLPHVDDALASLADAKYFSKMDANCGFWQIRLDRKSRELTTFITPYGRYCFNRMPFGISSAPENFQRQMSKVLKGLEGVLCHMDDVLVFGRTEEEHDSRLEKTLAAIRASGMTLNKEKCEFKVRSVDFLGHHVDGDGISAAQDKVKAILDMEPPKCPKELKRLLGMADYMRKFDSKMAEIEHPMRDLLRKRNEWLWGPDQDKAFVALKKTLTSFPTLVKFDMDKSHRVTADASQNALGAALLQREERGWCPVAYASRTLTETEKRYAQIEKEALAVTWACQKFDFYLVGRRFEVETDHKPLVPLSGGKDLSELPLRVQRFKLRLMRYEYSIFHSPGSSMHIADSLSRASYPDYRDKRREEKVEAHVQHIVHGGGVVDQDLEKIKEEQVKDEVCREVLVYCQTTWPVVKEVSSGAKRFHQFRDELFAHRGLLLRGHRLVVPEALHKQMLDRIHDGHQGIVKCSRRARESVWWPGINQQIKQLVEKCATCIKHQKIHHQPLKPTELPDGPWMEVGSDVFEFKGKAYVLIVDYYSRWVEVFEIKELTAKTVVAKMKNAFARFGVPVKVRSDNGGCYNSDLFRKFADAYGFGFEATTSSPRYPESNGLAERAIQTVKRLWKKSEDFNKSLMIYRATPLESGFAPAELMFGRNIRAGLPQLLVEEKGQFRERDSLLKQRQKENFDRRTGARPLEALEEGDGVWVKTNPNDGAHGLVMGDSGEPDSYLVNRGGITIRRNRKHMALLPEESGDRGGDETDTVPQPDASEEAAADPSPTTESPPEDAVNTERRTVSRYGRVSKPNRKYLGYTK